MGRRSRNDKRRYVCPECRRKTLVNRHKNNNKWEHLVWFCVHGQFLGARKAKTWERGQQAEQEFAAGQYSSLDDAYNDHFYFNSEREKYEELKKLREKTGVCGYRVEFDDRDATKDDLQTILDKMAGDETVFEIWLREQRPDTNLRGLKILYESDFAHVVKVRDKMGYGIWVYFEEVIENCRHSRYASGWPDRWAAMTRDPANYIKHEGIPIRKIWSQGERMLLWHKQRDSAHLSHGGKITAALKRQCIEWVKSLEAKAESYLEKANSELERWRQETRDLRAAIHPLSLDYLNSETQKARVTIRERLTPAEAQEVGDLLQKILWRREASQCS